MKIVQVEYRRLRSFGDYSNETLGAVAEVGDRAPDVVLAELQEWVDGQLKDEEHARDLSQKVWRSEARLRVLNGLLKTAGERFEYAKKILASHGIDVPVDHGTYADEDEIEGLPF